MSLQISGTGLSGYTLTYASQSSNPLAQTWEYSTDNKNWTTFQTVSTPTTQWGNSTLNFGGITALNGAANVYFRDSFAAGSTIHFDNFAISAVPEPTAYALPLFGFIFVAGTAARSYLRHRTAG